MLALVFVLPASSATPTEEAEAIQIAGVVGPERLALTPERPVVTKPVVVIIENSGEQPEIIPDAAGLGELVGLDVKPLGEAPPPHAALVPPSEFPIALQPTQKRAVVFEVTYSAPSPTASVLGYRYVATIRRQSPIFVGKGPATSSVTALASSTQARSSAATHRKRSVGLAPADTTASVVAHPTKVFLPAGAKLSAPIDFTAVWPDHAFFVSWETGGAAKDTQTNTTLTAQWSAPGDYVVGGYFYEFGGNLSNAPDPTVTIHVIGVKFQDENGNDPNGESIGVSTTTRDRQRTFTAVVTPASEVGSVTLKVSSGGKNLHITNVTPGSGMITFNVSGYGKTGSAKIGDCVIEADIEGRAAARAALTVVVPGKVTSQAAGASQTVNVQVNSATTPADPRIAANMAGLVTFYKFPVTVTVGDQFGRPVGDAMLYRGAPVFERFLTGGNLGAPLPINLTVSANSDYVDPVGIQVGKNYPGIGPLVGFNSSDATSFAALTNPVFALPQIATGQPQPQSVSTFQVVVEGFPLKPSISRTLTLTPHGLTLDETP